MSRRRRVRTPGRVRRSRAVVLTLCLVAAPAVLAGGCGSGASTALQASGSAGSSDSPTTMAISVGTASPAATPATPAPTPSTPAPTGAASSSTQPLPQVTAGPVPAGAITAVREFWRLLSERHFARARAQVAPGSPLADPGLRWGLAAARLLAVSPRALAAVPPYATVEFRTIVYVKPGAGTNAWGAAGSRSLWMTVTRMSDRSWRVYEFGTGP
jgi:hypothetical protein